MKFLTMHALIVVIVAAIAGEFTAGILRRIAWSIAAVAAVMAAWQSWQGR